METESSRIYVSGERVAPGDYQDIATGAIVRVQATDELPDGIRILHTTRRFIRVDGRGRWKSRPARKPVGPKP